MVMRRDGCHQHQSCHFTCLSKLQGIVFKHFSELGRFGAIAHRPLGTDDMTRLYVNTRAEHFQVMLDAVQNHSARVVVVDELRDAKEVEAARTIANQGVLWLAQRKLEANVHLATPLADSLSRTVVLG